MRVIILIIFSGFFIGNTNNLIKDKNLLAMQPSLEESEVWLINKLKRNLVDFSESSKYQTGVPITTWDHSYKKVYITDGNLIIEYESKTNTPKGYGQIGYNSDINTYRAKIPFNRIEYNKFDDSRTYSGKCSFTVHTESNAIEIQNIKKGTKYFKSSYKFAFDCSIDEILGKRLDKAIMHIHKLTPKRNLLDNDLF